MNVLYFITICAVSALEMTFPKISYLKDGSIEILVQGVPGLHVTHVTYLVDNIPYIGPFHLSGDGRWYHRNQNVGVLHDQQVDYTIFGELYEKPVALKGTFKPEKTVMMEPSPRVRRAGVVMHDDFTGNSLNRAFWNIEVSMYGGHNWEIQVYTSDERNIYFRNGHLYLKPTLTSEKFGEAYLTTGVMDVAQIWGTCTNAAHYGCHREGKNGLLPPVMSAKITSKQTIRYGKVTVRAKIPKGDWIWPAIWMLPRQEVYGGWPRSGEIDLMESRGNTVAQSPDGHNHGVNQVGSTLHWGPDAGNNRFSMTHGEKDNAALWSSNFHTYTLEWTEAHILCQVDGATILNVPTPPESFWNHGHFNGQNIWAGGSKSAPFDSHFYLILNVAIAGTNGFFPDNWLYNSPKPWTNNSPHEPADFWNHRSKWLPSWHGDDVAMIIDYVEMFQY